MDFSNALPDEGDASRSSLAREGRHIEKPRPSINKYYRPFSTSTTVLVTIALALGTCIALLEILVHDSTRVDGAISTTSRRDVEVWKQLDRRQIANSTTALATSISSYLTVSTDTTSASGTRPSVATFNEGPSSYQTLTTVGSAYETLKSGTTSPATQSTFSLPLIAPSAPSSDYETLANAPAGATTQTISPLSVVPLLTTQSTYETLTAQETTNGASSTAASGYETLQAPTSTQTDGKTQAVSATSQPLQSPQPIVVTTSTIDHSQGIKTTEPTTFSATGYVYFSLSTTTSGGSTFVATSTATAIVTGESTYLTAAVVTSDGSTTTAISTATALLTGQDLVIASTSTGAAPDPTPGQPISLKAGTEARVSNHFSTVDYFNAMYLSTLVAVFLKSVWSIVFAATKMMEPFYQLAQPGGTTAEDSLAADYLSSGLTISSLKAMLQGHWVVGLTSAVYLIFGVLTSLSTEAMSAKPTLYCATGVGNAAQPCNPVWVLELPIVRGVEVLAGVLIVMITALVIIQWNRSSGVYSDPSAIASMASLLHHPDVVEDLRNVDPDATTDELDRVLIGNQYMLGTYQSSPDTFRYGIIKTVGTTKLQSQHARYQAVSNPGDQQTNRHTALPWKSIRDVVFGLALLALFGLILAYYLDSKDDAFNKYFNSQTFGPRFILTFTAVIVDFQWKRLEREVRIMNVYRRLSERQARPDQTILRSMTGTPITTLPVAIWHGNFFTAIIASVALLSDILIISVGGVPFLRAEIYPAFLASVYVSLAILGLMVLCLVAIFIWRAGNPKMPRDPDTLACVWSYLCDSRLMEDMQGCGVMDAKKRNQMVRGMGKRYFFGRRGYQDGLERWCVDEDDHGGTVVY